jgi:hypothetical protein
MDTPPLSKRLLRVSKTHEFLQAKLDPMFLDYLLQVENEIEPVTIADKIKLPTTMKIPFIDDMTSLNALIDIVFLNINEYPNNLDIMINRAIYINTQK